MSSPPPHRRIRKNHLYVSSSTFFEDGPSRTDRQRYGIQWHDKHEEEGLMFPLQTKEDEKDTSSSSNREINNARLLLLVAAALYGTNFSFVKLLGESGMTVGVSSTVRFALAALFTSPWLFQLSPDNPQNNNNNNNQDCATTSSTNIFQELFFNPDSIEFKATLGGLEVGLWTSIGYVAQAVGLGSTSASESAFLCSLAVVVVPLFEKLTGKDLLPRQMVGALLAVLGVAFLEWDEVTSLSATMDTESLCSFLQPLAFGMAFWRMEKTMHQYPQEAARGTAAQLLGNFVFSLLYSFSVGDFASGLHISHHLRPFDSTLFSSFSTVDPMIWFSLFWTGCITTALTVYMETYALKTLSATEMTLIFSTEPLWGAACASMVMGETLGLNAAAGAAMIVSACVFSNLGMDGLKKYLMPSVSVEDDVTPSSETTSGL